MPRPGVPNNPGGSNGWQGTGTEQPYGEITNQKRLAQGAPLAGGKVAAGSINAPKRAGLDAKKKPKPKPSPPTGGTLFPPKPPPGGVIGPPTGVPPWTVEYPPGTIQNSGQVWQQILGMPGSDKYPILRLIGGRI